MWLSGTSPAGNEDINFGDPQTCIDLQNLSDINPAAVTDGFGFLQGCGPFFADSPYAIPANMIPDGFTLHLPDGSTVTGPNSQAIGLVGLRRYSSPNCKPIGGWETPSSLGTGGFINGCPHDGVPIFSSIFAQDTIANSNYNSMQVSLESVCLTDSNSRWPTPGASRLMTPQVSKTS